jgi:hypothetical protein
MRQLALLVLGVLVLSLSTVGCGRDRSDRGLTPPDENAAPMGDEALRETEAERDKQTTRAEQDLEEHDFDRAEDR